MKKFAPLSILMCLLLLLECLSMSASALSNLQTVPPQTDPATQESQANAAPKLDFGTVCIYQGCRTIEAGVAIGTSERILETAQAAVLFEANTNTMIYSYNPDVKLAPGSLAKVVTALVVIEQCDLDEKVIVHSRNISRLPAQTQHVDLKEAEELTVRDLLYCLLLKGANDAAIALSEHVSGNMQGFVVLMNDRVKQMGCTHTEFANVHGLDNATQYTTARDMARIMMEAYKNKTFVEISSTVSYTVPKTNRSEEREFRTINYLIDEFIVPQFYDTRVQTGFAANSEASGAGLICVAETTSKNDPSRNMKLVGVILGAHRVFEDNSWRVKSYGNFNEMIDLLEYGFNNFKVNRIIYDGQALNQFSVIGGESEAVGQPHVNIDTVLPADCNMKNLEMRYSVTGGSLTAPVRAEDMISTVQVWYRNSCVAEAELYAMSDVHKSDELDVTIHSHISNQQKKSGGFMSTLGTICLVILGVVAVYLVVNTIHRRRMAAKRRRRRANRRRSY